MKIVQKTAGRLVLQERPWLVLLVGGLFVIAGMVVAMGAGEPLAGMGSALLGAIVILAFGNTVTATFDRTIGRLTRAVRGPVRNSEVTHPLSDITGVTVDTSTASRGSPSYRVVLVLASGARVPLTTSYSSGKSGKEESAAAIGQFLNLSQGPEIRIPGFGDMVGMMFDPNAVNRLGEMFDGPDEARKHLAAARDLATRRGNPALAAKIDEMLSRMNASQSRSNPTAGQS